MKRVRPVRFEVYPAADGGWCWRAARGGHIIADSGESYVTRAGAVRAVTAFVNALDAGHADIVVRNADGDEKVVLW